jgi:hypothetical protein
MNANDQAGVNSLHRSGKSQHRRQPVNVDTERQRNPGSVRIPPPGFRSDSRGATRLIRSEVVKGGSHFRNLNPEIDHRLTLPFNRIKHLL